MKRLAIVLALIIFGSFGFGSFGVVSGQDRSSDTRSETAAVTWDRLVNAADEPQNWLMYSGTFDSKRHSGLDQVHNRNVHRLELKWAYQLSALDRAETTPLVVDGVMFITEAPSNVVAVDAATGRSYWRYEHELPDDLRICCGRNNRGVAILGDTLYMSTLDAHLAAIDAKTGNLLWAAEAADYRSGYSKTAAPLIVKDKGFCCNFGPATSGWTVFDNDWTGSPSCPATIRSNGVSSNQDSSSCVFGGTCGMP